MFHEIESAKDKMLEADPNLEKSMTISMTRHRKMLAPHRKLYQEKKARAVHTTSR